MAKNRIIFGKPIAVLVDGAFFLKRYNACFRGGRSHGPAEVASNLYTMVLAHVENEELYRIFFYDCPPLDKKVHNPVSGQSIDFSKSQTASFRNQLHVELSRKRKIALRLGILKDTSGKWRIRPRKLKELFQKRIEFKDLGADDVSY
jgi:uncharacterized LabA/DUF88 family protein